jgi:hypothetical protein
LQVSSLLGLAKNCSKLFYLQFFRFLKSLKFMTRVINIIQGRNTKKFLKTLVFASILSILLIIQATALGETTPFLYVTNTDGTTTTIPPDYLLTLPKTTVYAELYCYGNLVTAGDWSGVKLTDLLTQVGEIDENTDSIYFEAQDGYKVRIPIKTAIREDVLIAYEKDGVSLPEGLRLVIPGTNGNLWIALIVSITLSTEQVPEGLSSNTDSSPVNIPFTPSQPTPKSTQPQVQPTPTMQPDANTTIEPVVPPVNITQQEPVTDYNTTKEHISGAYTLDFSVELISAMFTSILIVSVVMFMVFRRRTRT